MLLSHSLLFYVSSIGKNWLFPQKKKSRFSEFLGIDLQNQKVFTIQRKQKNLLLFYLTKNKKDNLLAMNFSQLFKKSNSSSYLLEGNIVNSSVIQIRKDLVVIDTGLSNTLLCFQNELKMSEKGQVPENCHIGIEKIQKNNDEPLLVLPKLVEKYSKRKLVWNELSKIWGNRRNNRIKGFILNAVKGGYAVAIAGQIAFLPKSLCIYKKVYYGQWRFFSIVNMNPRINNIVVKERFPRLKNRKLGKTKLKDFRRKNGKFLSLDSMKLSRTKSSR